MLYTLYFSATGTTKTIVQTVAKQMGTIARDYDFTLPTAREREYVFQPGDIVVCGCPVYAGRVPNVLLEFFSRLQGNGALAIPVVVYGNRDYDDALIELRDLLRGRGFRPVAAAAFVGAHAFSDTLAKGRPDEKDLKMAALFGQMARIQCENGAQKTLLVKGRETGRTYYQPRTKEGAPIDIRRVKPQTKGCVHCGLCAELCPMGAIDKENPSRVSGICIKCGACVKRCPNHAKFFADEGYQYHLRELETTFTARREPEVFI